MGPILGVIQIAANLWVNFEGISLVGSALFGLGVISWTQDMWVFWGLGISKTWSSTRPSSLMPMTRGKIASRFSTTRSARGPFGPRRTWPNSQAEAEISDRHWRPAHLPDTLTLLPHLFEITSLARSQQVCIVQIALPELWPHRGHRGNENGRHTRKHRMKLQGKSFKMSIHFELFDPKKWGIEWSLSYADSNYWENVDDSFEGQHVHSHF